MKILLIWLPIIRDVVITVFLCVLFYNMNKGYYFGFPVTIEGLIRVPDIRVDTGYQGDRPIDIRVRN